MTKEEARKKFESDLVRVKDAIVAASEHYNVWYIYKHDRPKYVDVMNRYLGFFSTSISAQFTAMLLTLAKTLDKKNISIYSLVKSAETHNFLKSTELAEVKTKLNGIKELVGRMQLLRSNQFAHLGNLDSVNAFKRAGLSLKDFKKLIDCSIDILRKIHYGYNRDDFAFDYYSKQDTCSLLDDLMKK